VLVLDPKNAGPPYSTLQNLRINGKLKYTKVGGTIFYRWEDVEEMLQSNPQTNISLY